jgi:hypothetical protein
LMQLWVSIAYESIDDEGAMSRSNSASHSWTVERWWVAMGDRQVRECGDRLRWTHQQIFTRIDDLFTEINHESSWFEIFSLDLREFQKKFKEVEMWRSLVKLELVFQF